MVFTGPSLSARFNIPPFRTPVNTYGARRDSAVMDVFFRADYTLKFLTSSSRPVEFIPEHQASQEFFAAAENRAAASAGRSPQEGVIRYWIYLDSVALDPLQGNFGVRFRNAKVIG